MSPEGIRPSEFYEKVQESAPDITKAEIKDYLQGTVRDSARELGQERPTVSDYRYYIKEVYGYLAEETQAVVEAIRSSSYYSKLESLIDPEVLPRFNGRLAQLVSSNMAVECANRAISAFEFVPNETPDEASLRLISEINSEIEQRVRAVFNDSVIKELFPDDPVLITKLEEYYTKSATSVMSKFFGPRLAGLLDEIEDSGITS